MERIKPFFIVLFIFFITMLPVKSEDLMNLSTLITPQNIRYEACTKVFAIDNVSLFYLTIASINANRFKIDEIQSKSGYIIFTVVNRKFLASVSNVNTKQSMLKITPVDNNYYFQPGILSNIFAYIDINLNGKIININLN